MREPVISDTASMYAFLAFLLCLTVFVLWKTPIGPEVRSWFTRRMGDRTYAYDEKELDHLLGEATSICGSQVRNQLALAKFMAHPPKTLDTVDRYLNMLEGAKDHLLELAAELGHGERKILLPGQRLAAVVPMESKRTRSVWVDGHLRPGDP